MLNTRSENKLEVIREWANEVLEGRRLMSEKVINVTISQIHKNTETTNRTKDWRPVVLLNGTNQLISYVICERLKDIVEKEQAGLKLVRLGTEWREVRTST